MFARGIMAQDTVAIVRILAVAEIPIRQVCLIFKRQTRFFYNKTPPVRRGLGLLFYFAAALAITALNSSGLATLNSDRILRSMMILCFFKAPMNWL